MSDAYESILKIRDAYKLNPAAVKLWVAGWIIKIGLIVGACAVSYYQGRDSANTAWEAKVEKQRLEIADLKNKNTTAALERKAERLQWQASQNAAVDAAVKEIENYYRKNPVERIVEKSKLVPVPGKQEYVYVPDGTCPNDMFNPDELRLYNQGLEGYDPNPKHPK